MPLPSYFLGPDFRELMAELLGYRLATDVVMVQWLRPQTHMEWFLNCLQTYKMFERNMHML
jgi:hypothetical protein